MSKRNADDTEKCSERPRKRRSRWQENDEEKSILTGLPTTIPSGLTKEQEEQYILQLQIEEITRRLRTGELGIPANVEERSPSPEPIYDNTGKRLNTREFRVRKKLEEERHKLILEVTKANPEYKPPFDYRPLNIKVNDKVMIPQEEHPSINFVGLLIGPRGNTLKSLEKETGACIIIRGKGSVKEGKLGIKNGLPLPGQDEPLHAYVTAPNPECVKKAVDRIKEIIREGIAVPDAENDLRKQQLRELALLNGTLREGDALSKLKQLQQAQTIITNTILCTTCGGAGHIAQDCKQKRPSESLKAMLNQSGESSALPSFADRTKMDSEYMSLMAELGETVSTPSNTSSVVSKPSVATALWNPTPVPPPSQLPPLRMPPTNPMPWQPPYGNNSYVGGQSGYSQMYPWLAAPAAWQPMMGGAPWMADQSPPPHCPPPPPPPSI